MLYRKKEYFNSIHSSIIPCVSGLDIPKEKIDVLLEMSHLIESAYNKVCIDLTRHDFLEYIFRFGVTHLKTQLNALCVLSDF